MQARVEHVFAVVKRLWGFDKVRYRGLAKNATRSFVALGLANIYLARGVLDQGPAYADIAPIARALLAAAPDRVVWGSDWPHTGGANRPADYKPADLEPFRVEDDGRDIGLIKDWVPDARQRQKLLVDNPAQLFGFR